MRNKTPSEGPLWPIAKAKYDRLLGSTAYSQALRLVHEGRYVLSANIEGNMTGGLAAAKSGLLKTTIRGEGMLPLIARPRGGAEKRFLEFSAAKISNRSAREAHLWVLQDFLAGSKLLRDRRSP